MTLPLLNTVPCFIQCPEPMLIKAFISKFTVKALHKRILSWFTWLNKAQANTFGFTPEEHRLAGKFSAVVANNRVWLVASLNDLR